MLHYFLTYIKKHFPSSLHILYTATDHSFIVMLPRLAVIMQQCADYWRNCRCIYTPMTGLNWRIMNNEWIWDVAMNELPAVNAEAALQRCFYVFWTFAVNLQENTRHKCDFNKVAKQLRWNLFLAWLVSCKLATYFQKNFC